MEDLNFGILGALENQRELTRSCLNEILSEALTPALREHLPAQPSPVPEVITASVFERVEDEDLGTCTALLETADRLDPGERVVLVDLLFLAFVNGHTDALPTLLDLAETGEPLVEAETAMIFGLILGDPKTVKHLNARPKTAARLRRFIAQDDVFPWFSLVDQAICGLVLGEATLLGDAECRLEAPVSQVFTWLKPYSPRDGQAYLHRDDQPALRRLLPMLDEAYGLSPFEKRLLDALAAQGHPAVEKAVNSLSREEAVVTMPFFFERIKLTERLFVLFQFCRVFSLEPVVTFILERSGGFKKKLDRWVERPSVKTLFIARRACAGTIYALRDGDHHRAEEAAQAAHDAYTDLDQNEPLSENDLTAWFQALSTAAQATEDADLAYEWCRLSLSLLERLAPFFPEYAPFYYVWGFTFSGAAEWCEDRKTAAGHRQAALAKYAVCLELTPRDPSALFGIAYEYGEEASEAEEVSEQRALRRSAIKTYREALAVKPRMGNAHYNWGNELFQCARIAEEPTEKIELFKEAALHYNECAEIRSRDVESQEKCAGQLAAVSREMTDPLLRTRYLKEAIGLLDILLSLEPDRPDIALLLGHHWDDLAEAAQREDRCREFREQAVKRYQDATVLDPEEERAFFHLGYQKSCLAALYPDAERVGTLRRQAITHYGRAQELNPAMHLVHYNRGYEHEQLLALTHDPKERERLRLAALIEFEMYVRREPDAGSGHFKLAYHLDESAFSLNDPAACRETLDRAVYHYKQALASAPEDETTWYYLGLAWLRLADYSNDAAKTLHWLNEARQTFAEALRINGQLHGAQVGMACVFAAMAKCDDTVDRQMEHHRSAAIHYQTALALKPEEAEDWFQLGFQTESLGRLSRDDTQRRSFLLEALGYYKKALGFQPGKISALYQWGCSLAELAEICVDRCQKEAYHHAAADKFRGVYQLNPNAGNALTEWGNQLHRLACLSEQDETAQDLHHQALAVFQKVLDEKPNDPFATYNVGVQTTYAAHYTQDVEQRRDLLQQARDLFRACLKAPAQKTRIPFVAMADRLQKLAELLGDPAFDEALDAVVDGLFALAEAHAIPADRLHFHQGCALSQRAKRCKDPARAKALRRQAVSAYERHLAAWPDDLVGMEQMADEHNRLADLEEDREQRHAALNTALALHTRVLEQTPQRADAYFRVAEQCGVLAREEERPEQIRDQRYQAVAYYHKALGCDRTHIPSLINLGVELGALADATQHVDRRRELHLQAVSTLKRAASAGSRHHLIYFTLAHQLTHLAFLAEEPAQAQSLFVEAADNYAQVTRHRPENYAAWRNWGYLLDHMAGTCGDGAQRRVLWREALAKYERGLKADLEPYQALVNHSRQCELKAKLSDDPAEKHRLLHDAHTFYRKACRLNPQHKELLSMALNCSKKLLMLASDEDQGRILADEAEAIIHQLSSITGIPIDRNYNYACVLALSGKRHEALRVLEQCLRERAVLPRQVAQDPDWTDLHNEPEFTRLMERFV